MKKKIILTVYIVVSLIWYQYIFNLNGGEAALFPTLMTIIVTAPVGIVLFLLNYILPMGEFFVPLILVANYFQWIIIIKIIKNFYQKEPSTSQIQM